MTFGKTIKTHRETKGLLLRQVAAFLEVDTAFVSKLERNKRNASKQQVEKLAAVLDIQADELFTIWLSDKILTVITNHTQGVAALKLAIKKCKSK